MDHATQQLINVEQVAENTPSHVIDGWEAFERCDPGQNMRYIMAVLASEITRLQMLQTGNEKALRKIEDFMPQSWVDQPPPKPPATLEETQSFLERMYS